MPKKTKRPPRKPRGRPTLTVTLAPEVLAEVKRRAAGGVPSTPRRASRVVEEGLREAFRLPEPA